MKHEHNIQKTFRVFISYNLYIIAFNQHIKHYSKPKHKVPILIRYTNSRISKSLQISHLLKRVGKLFLEGPHSKYFRLCKPYNLCCNYSKQP